MLSKSRFRYVHLNFYNDNLFFNLSKIDNGFKFVELKDKYGQEVKSRLDQNYRMLKDVIT